MTLLHRLAAQIDTMARRGRILVAFDGPDAAGKTTLANRVADTVAVPAFRASIDDFHRPRAVRQMCGPLSPEGYFRDAFDYDTLETQLLGPFARGESRVRTRCFDWASDQAVTEYADVPADAALLVDGVFLLRPELRHWWDLSIYLHVSEEVTLARAVERDLQFFGHPAEIEARYRARYLPGQALYRDACHPLDVAHIVADNADPSTPLLSKWTPRGASPSEVR